VNETASSLANLVGGRLSAGDPLTPLTGFNGIGDAIPGDLTFLGNSRYAAQLAASAASAALVPPGTTGLPTSLALIEVANPSLAFGQVVARFGRTRPSPEPGVDPAAFVHPTATLDPSSVSIAPGATIAAQSTLGPGTVIGAGAHIGHSAVLGRDCFIHPNATILDGTVIGDRVIIHSGAVIGSDGFGYENQGGRHLKIDQVGIVQLDDDVEIGAGTTIDRARFGKTHIGEGTKVDNLCQIAHNVVIGRHCIIVAQTGIAGSAKIGDHVTIAAQSGVGGHIQIASHSLILGRAGVTKDITAPGAYMGFPSQPMREEKKAQVLARRLPELSQQVKDLRTRLAQLEAALPQDAP
jgi:UDP-3-O-[3-hydroxymyristoyl] glucosamine N-acyltransferase